MQRRNTSLTKLSKLPDKREEHDDSARLLHSVRDDHSGPYLSALEARGIPAFCPRARAYFENEEIRLMVACFAVLFGWHGQGRGQVAGSVADLATYVDRGIVDLGRAYSTPNPLALFLQARVAEIAALRDRQSLDLRPADYFYRLLALEPFAKAIRDEAAGDRAPARTDADRL